MEESLIKHIRPGEFTFCSRCGDNVHYGKEDFMCFSCQRAFFGMEYDKEQGLKEEYERQISQLIRQHREALAKLRSEEAE